MRDFVPNTQDFSPSPIYTMSGQGSDELLTHSLEIIDKLFKLLQHDIQVGLVNGENMLICEKCHVEMVKNGVFTGTDGVKGGT